MNLDIVERIMQAVHDWWVAALVILSFVLWFIAIIYDKKINGKLYFEKKAEKEAKKAAREEKKRRKEAQRWWYQ